MKNTKKVNSKSEKYNSEVLNEYESLFLVNQKQKTIEGKMSALRLELDHYAEVMNDLNHLESVALIEISLINEEYEIANYSPESYLKDNAIKSDLLPF